MNKKIYNIYKLNLQKEVIVINKVILIGCLTKDPELRFLQGDGKAVARFTLAVNRQFKKDEADFISCTVWGKLAETMAQYCVKGSKIAVTGSIRTGSYEDKSGNKVFYPSIWHENKSGNKKYTTDVNVEGFEFEGGKKSEGSSYNSDNNYNYNDSFNGGSAFDGPDEITPVSTGSDMPF